MRLDEGLDDGETDARPPSAGNPVEHLEDPVPVGLGDARTAVLHRDLDHVTDDVAAD